MWRWFFFTLLSHTSTPISRFLFVDLDPAAVFMPVAYFFDTHNIYGWYIFPSYSRIFILAVGRPIGRTFIVYAGLETLEFKNLFPHWEDEEEIADVMRKVISCWSKKIIVPFFMTSLWFLSWLHFGRNSSPIIGQWIKLTAYEVFRLDTSSSSSSSSSFIYLTKATFKKNS